MNDWRADLAKLAAARGTDQYPLCVFEVAPTSGQPWPKSVPSCPAIRDFYKLCDGGTLSLQYTFHSLAEVVSETNRWVAELELQPEGEGPPLVAGRHAVVATDSGGALVVWDKTRKRLRTLVWNGGGWENDDWDFEDFMRALFFDPGRVQADDLWVKALQQLRGEAAAGG